MKHIRKTKQEELIETVKKYINDKGSKSIIAREYEISLPFFIECVARYREQGAFSFVDNTHNNIYLNKLAYMQLKYAD